MVTRRPKSVTSVAAASGSTGPPISVSAARLRLGVFGRQIGGGGERQRRGLADGDDMGVGAQAPHELDEIERVILDIELARRHRNVAGIVPVGHKDIASGSRLATVERSSVA